MFRKIILYIVICILSASCAVTENKPIKSWAGHTAYSAKRNYSHLIVRIKRLESKYITISEAGTVSYGILSYPLLEINYRNSSNNKHTALITGGVHGNEPAGVEAILQYMEYLKLHGPVQNYDVHFVPVVNPWGWCHNSRYNGDGYDVNRDFNSLSRNFDFVIV